MQGAEHRVRLRPWKTKSIEQRYLELFQRYLERQTIYDWHTASFQGRNNYCKQTRMQRLCI